MKPVGKAAACAEGGCLEPFVLLEPPAHNAGCSCVIGLTYRSGTSKFSCVQLAAEPLEYSAESRDRTGSQHDIQCSEPAAVARGQKCALGSSRCELPLVHSVPKSAVLPYASGVGGLSRRLLNPVWPSCSSAEAR